MRNSLIPREIRAGDVACTRGRPSHQKYFFRWLSEATLPGPVNQHCSGPLREVVGQERDGFAFGAGQIVASAKTRGAADRLVKYQPAGVAFARGELHGHGYLVVKRGKKSVGCTLDSVRLYGVMTPVTTTCPAVKCQPVGSVLLQILPKGVHNVIHQARFQGLVGERINFN